jgi:acrylyl-CoA reductase (NADPH)
MGSAGSRESVGRSRCWLVSRSASGAWGRLAELPWDSAEQPADEAVVIVEAAGFNYKDALACAGHPGVMRLDPLVPGIDAAGRLAAAAGGMAAGAPVIVTAHGMGEHRHGGFATHVRMPTAAILPRPAGLDAVAAMAFGTAGLTVILACERLAALVEDGGEAEWLVTGASGGVGMLAVARLAAAGHRVVAASRKPAAREALSALGAAVVATPDEIVDPGSKSLARGRWAGVIDTVGGPLLADVLRSVRVGGAVAAVGMAGGHDLVTTVHPFILRGVTLTGIDTAMRPTPADRRRLWDELAGFWPRIRDVFPITRLALADVGDWGSRMLRGETSGRGVVVP